MNKAKMRAVMALHNDNQEKLAEALDLPVSGVNARINGKVDFRMSEVQVIMRRYKLSLAEAGEIFFDGIAS